MIFGAMLKLFKVVLFSSNLFLAFLKTKKEKEANANALASRKGHKGG